MSENIGSIEKIPDQPEISEGLTKAGVTVHPTQPEPLPRGAGESSSWLGVLKARLGKIALKRGT